MEIVETSGSRRQLNERDESSSKRVQSLAGMLLFDDNDRSDWQDSIREAHPSNLNDEQQGPEDIMDHREQPDTDIPGAMLNGNRICTAIALASCSTR